ncbi:MAG: hypothetical protein ABIR06_05090 [Cyclobacteriaceae bacterium]
MKKVFALILFSLLLQAGLAQEKQLDTLIRRFDDYRVRALQEKIYAHLDRTFYLTGETLWFKIYAVDGSFHKPLNVSKVAYVEIMDKGNLSVMQAKIELNHGSGNGSFFLPASLGSGHYSFRVYTHWMKNFSPEFFFHQDFTIVNPFVKPVSEPDKRPPSHTLAFFPEGGNLVTGIRSKIGFRVLNALGKGSFGKGFVLNNMGDTVTFFTSSKFGIGNFLFTPAENEKYTAVLQDEQGNKSAQNFPEVYKSGYVMQLIDSGDFININLKNKGEQGFFVYLFVHARQIIVKATLQMMRENITSVVFKKSELPEGISHFTLFNDQLQPLCERLFFTYPKKHLAIQVENNQHEYNQRRKVSLSLQTSTNSGKSSSANLSMAVYKIDSLASIEQTGIFHHLWLGADLTGSIDSPDYYFNTNDLQAVQGMDNLMLTHGWRRFDWKDVLKKNDAFEFVPEHNGHIITGVVTQDHVKQRGVLTYLASPGNIIRAYGSRSSDHGKIHFEIKDFYGPRLVIIQTQADTTRTYDITIQNPFFPAVSSHSPPAFKITDNVSQKLLSRSMAMQVQDVFYYEQYGNRFLKPKVDSSAFYGEADATYFLDDYTRFQVMEEVMREYVPGVFVRKRKDGFHFILADAVNGGVLSGDPMILLDGVPVFDVDDIMRVDPLQVKKLEVVTRQYYLGPAAFSGIVSYTTYQGNLGGLKLDPGSVSLNYDGLQLKREFYSPHYENESQRNNKMPDQRYLLYWNPEIIIDQYGQGKVEFYTSDVEGTYRVVVEGSNNEGFLGSFDQNFVVKPRENQ